MESSFLGISTRTIKVTAVIIALCPDEHEFEEIESWLAEHSDLVFIRSAVSSAVAACEHYTDVGRSQIGELEHSAKYGGSSSAKKKLVKVLADVFGRLFSGKNIQGIVSVPSSTAGTTSLPNYLAAELAAELGLPDLTSALAWEGPKPSLKELPVDQKWTALEAVGLAVDNSVSGRNLVLIDDMYQSGATVHYVASRLREAGADDINVLAVSKGRRDTDNT